MSDISETVEPPALVKAKSDVSPPQSAGASVLGVAVTVAERINERVGSYRWLICALLFFAATINYIDRQVMASSSQHFRRRLDGMKLIIAG